MLDKRTPLDDTNTASLEVDDPKEYLQQLIIKTNTNSPETEQYDSVLGSLHGIPSLHLLKLWQGNLIDSIWFGKKDGDVPVPIINDFLYLSSCFACTRENLVANGIDNVIRLGWGFHTPLEETGTLYI